MLLGQLATRRVYGIRDLAGHGREGSLARGLYRGRRELLFDALAV